MILTLNEAANIRRSLHGLTWAQQIVVVDSFSTDDTLAIAREYPSVCVLQRQFDNHTAQWNFGLDHVPTDWVLALDADYLLGTDFVSEISQLDLSRPDVAAWFARFWYCVAGHRLQSSLYPPRAVLFRKSRCRYIEDGHSQLLEVQGATRTLKARILHDDRKPLRRWIASQAAYAKLEVEKLANTPSRELGWKDRIRAKIVFAPVLTTFYCLFVKRLILDGWPGVFYSMQRSYAELLLSLELLDRRMRKQEKKVPAAGGSESLED